MLPLLQSGNGKCPDIQMSHLFPVTFSLHVHIPSELHVIFAEPWSLHPHAKWFQNYNMISFTTLIHIYSGYTEVLISFVQNLWILPLLQSGNGKWPSIQTSHLSPVIFSLHSHIPSELHDNLAEPWALHSHSKRFQNYNMNSFATLIHIYSGFT